MSRFTQDIKERFLNFETAKGIYLVPAGLIVVFASIYYISYVIQVAFGLFGWYLFSEGLRKIFVNRIKQSLENDLLKSARKSADGVREDD